MSTVRSYSRSKPCDPTAPTTRSLYDMKSKLKVTKKRTAIVLKINYRKKTKSITKKRLKRRRRRRRHHHHHHHLLLYPSLLLSERQLGIS